MMQPLRLLLVEDSPFDAELTLAALEGGGYLCDAVVVDNEHDFVARLAENGFDIILADFVLPSFSGAEALSLARAGAPDVPFIFVSGVLGEEHAVDMLKQGATDYVLKQRLQRLPAVVRRALTERAERVERISAQRALRATETHFRLVVDALKDYAVITLDPDGRILTCNGAAQRILGYTAAELAGSSAEVFYSEEDRAERVFTRELERARVADSTTDDRWLWRKGAEAFFADGVTTAVRDESGALIGFSKILRDVTGARMAAEALHRAKEEAETANRAKDHFLAVLSHELRTPLTPILAAVRLLELQYDLPDDALHSLNVIRRNVELEARLIDDLLDLTSIARGKLSLNFETVGLTRLIESAVSMAEPRLEGKRLRLTTRFEASGTTVSGDSARLQQILWNLMTNAVKFTPEDGAIEILVTNPTPETVSVAVTDTGIGINPEALARIFSAFEQADASITRAFGGLGLGLAIASMLAQKHGGTLTAHSEGRGKGATFTLTLPAVLEQAVEDTGAASAPHTARRRMHVLLVEDNEYTSSAMAQLLEIVGHTVSVAASVATATQMIRSTAFDLLISDIGLPDGSGLDIAPVWTRCRDGKPSIAITGYGMEEDVQRCLLAGFSAHLTKPVDFDRLEAMIDTVALPGGTSE
jgi:PAS domain S-box-containing protein